MIKVFVDTDILIDYSKSKDTVLERLLVQKGMNLYINPVVVAEFLADHNLIDRQKLAEALDFLGRFKTVNATKKIGILTGELMRQNRNLNWKDAMIAATCLVEDCVLATRNRKHFEAISGLEFV